MTDWTLTVEFPSELAHLTHGTASDRTEAAAELIATTRRQITGMHVPARFTLIIERSIVAVIVSTNNERGQPDRTGSLELLDRIDLSDNSRSLAID